MSNLRRQTHNQTNNRRHHGRSHNQNGRAKIYKSTIFPHDSRQEEIVKSPNAWQPCRNGPTLQDADGSWSIPVERRFRGLLNKLTVEKMISVSSQLADTVSSTMTSSPSAPQKLAVLCAAAGALVEQALQQTKFASMYSQLAVRLSQTLPGLVVNLNTLTFQRLLLNKCQREFEQGCNQDMMELQRVNLDARPQGRTGIQKISLPAFTEVYLAARHLEILQVVPCLPSELASIVVAYVRPSSDEATKQQLRQKQKRLATLQFIAALHAQGIVTAQIVHSCLHSLLSVNSEAAVEGACCLLSQTGKRLELQPAPISAYLSHLQKIARSPCDTRLRYLCLNLLELRKLKWVPRIDQVVQPSTLEHIRTEHARQLPPPRRNRQGRGRNRQGRGNGI